MENNYVTFYTDLKQAVEDGDEVTFDEVLKKRTEYLAGLAEEATKKEALLYFIQMDKTLAVLIEAKKNGFKELLLTQNNQLKAVEKYEKF